MPESLPEYIRKSVPSPLSGRAPWYKSTFPTYAGIFLWVGFYLNLGGPTLGYAGVWTCLAGLLAAGFLCCAFYYYVPAMMGMQTGRSLYVLGSSTFGTRGGYLAPGILMGLLQIGWVAVIAAISADFIMRGLKLESKALFSVIVLAWVYSLGWVAIKGIHYVGRVAKISNWVPLLMILVVFWANRSGVSHFQPPHQGAATGFLNVLTIVIGFFATAGAAGADFGMNNRNRADIVLGGVCGIIGGTVVAGGLALLSVAGYLGRVPGANDFAFTAAISSVGALAPAMFFLLAAASLVPTCFSSFIASNSFSAMLPNIPRAVSTMCALTVSAALAITGIANHLVDFFGVVGASFGPICGAMAADYLVAGRKWPGPRVGINWAGVLAWAAGFLAGVPSLIPGAPQALIAIDNPAPLFSFIVGFAVYFALARLGLQPVASSAGESANDSGYCAGVAPVSEANRA